MRRSPSLLRRTGVLAALVLTLLPLSSAAHLPRGRTSVASAGLVSAPLSARERRKAAVRRQLAERGGGTYIAEMLAERDSSLARWPDRGGRPLRVWVQPHSDLAGWNPRYVGEVRTAFARWDALALPIRFAFVADSAAADVHVTFVDRFAEEISGRTKWTRDDDWWITDADIILALNHHGGARLDEAAIHAMALHEIGHLLGLDHTGDPGSIMAARVRVRALAAVDRATVRLLYTLPPGGVR